MTDKIIKIGVIGTSWWSDAMYMPALAKHPNAQVVAVSAAGRNRAVAFVMLEPGATFDEADALARCGARLADYKRPARIVPLDAFPFTDSANGMKIQRARLRAMAVEAIAETAPAKAG